MLATLGHDLGLDVWVAANDRNVTYNGVKLGDISIGALPTGLPDDIRKRIGLIDVIWLDDNNYRAAFEVEATTGILSGLARMGDLVALVPNFDIPLFIVAPDSRRGRVFDEIKRPIFSRALKKPLHRRCRYISVDTLESELTLLGPKVKMIRPQGQDDGSRAVLERNRRRSTLEVSRRTGQFLTHLSPRTRDLKAPMLIGGSMRWSERWQFGHRTTKSATRVVVVPVRRWSGLVWWHSKMLPVKSPKRSAAWLSEKSQTSHRNSPYSLRIFAFFSAAFLGARSRWRCHRHTTMPSRTPSSSSSGSAGMVPVAAPERMRCARSASSS
jgi:hypothetical protein